MGYLEALEDTKGDGAASTSSEANVKEVEDLEAFGSSLARYESTANDVDDHSPLGLQSSASNVSSTSSPKPVVASKTTPSKKRNYTVAQLAEEDKDLADDWQAYTQQAEGPTTNHPTTSNIPKPFISPNLSLARSIDHAKTNPSNTVRLKTPYPAPHDILTASKRKYQSNIDVANAKAATGAPDTSNRIPFTIYEDDQIIAHMLAVSQDPSVPQTEERFAEVSRRLCGDGRGVYRSGTAIKNMWCRVGRGRSGFDERKGVRRRGDHVVNGWRAKPGNEKKKFDNNKNKRVKVAHGVGFGGDDGANDAWFDM